MTTHRLNLQSAYFEHIKSGEKTVEMRLFDEKRQQITVGDHIIFNDTQTGEQLEVEVTALDRFPDFAALYAHFPKTAIGYGENDPAHPDDMLSIYPKEKMEKYGTLAISLRVLSK